MNLRLRRSCWLHGTGLLFLAVLMVAATWQLRQPLWDDPEIVLELGGTYEEMRKHSTAPFSPLIRGHVWADSQDRCSLAIYRSTLWI